MKSYVLTSLLASFAFLGACGGGGSSGSASPAPGPAPAPGPSGATYNALAAWTNLLSTTRSWTVDGQGSDGLAYQLSLAVEPGGAAVFPVTGASAVKSNFRNRLMQQATAVQDVLNEQFIDAQYRLLGSRVSTDGGAPRCSKTDVIAALPQAGVAVGATGPLYAATTLSDCSAGAVPLGTSYHTWSVREEGGVVFLCVASSNRFLSDTTDRLSETCIETDAAGNLGQRARIQLTLPGFSVTATN